MTRPGGRPALVTTQDILDAGRRLGMHRLSMNAVAAELGVSATALYRHIDGRWELERLIGESLLAGLELRDDPRDGIERHLLSFGMQLRSFALSNPGLASYLQVLFPRGAQGARLLAAEVEAIGRRGYSTDAAIMLSGGVASLAIGLAAGQERGAAATGTAGFAREREAAAGRLAADEFLGPAHTALPQITADAYAGLLLTAAIRGLVSVAPPGRPVAEVLAELSEPSDESGVV